MDFYYWLRRATWHVHSHLHVINHKLNKIIARLDQQEEQHMSDQAALDAAIASVQQAVTDTGARLSQQIQDLKDQVTAGDEVQPADLDALAATAAALSDPNFGQPGGPASPATP